MLFSWNQGYFFFQEKGNLYNAQQSNLRENLFLGQKKKDGIRRENTSIERDRQTDQIVLNLGKRHTQALYKDILGFQL